MKVLLFILILNYPLLTLADYLPWNVLEKKFQKLSPHSKILSHVQCFFESYSHATFALKKINNQQFFNRCNYNPEIQMNSKRYFSVVDYTVESNQKRMFLIDRLTGQITSMAVAHGRYHAGFFNQSLEENKNSVKEIKYFSNTINSMASSSGFFIAGQDYQASDFGRSLILHGLESGINDNACERDVVLHKHFLVTKKKVYMSSSGCLMISPKLNDQVISLLRGKSGDDLKLESGGSLIFIYGPREKDWPINSCEGKFTLVQ